MNEKRKLVKVIVIAALLLVGTLGIASAQTSGNLTLTGNVPGILLVEVSESAEAANLDLTANVSNLAVGTVTERSNKKGGYTVTLQSANAVAAGSLVFKSSDASNTDTLAYSISYGGTPVALDQGAALVSDSLEKTTGTGTVNSIEISYDGTGLFLYEDSYSDTLTFTIAAK